MRTAAALLGVLVVAGCFGGSKDPTTPSMSVSPDANPTATVSVEAPLPLWEIGQGWTYAVEVPGKATRTFEMMVAEDRENLWVVASSDRAQAIHHAVYSTNPVLGRISKTTLSPFQSGEPVEMFQFPLHDGKTWTATFFGEGTTFTSRYAGDIDVSHVAPDHGLGQFVEGFRIDADGASGRTTRYDYVEAIGWFTSFEVLAPDRSREIRLTLQDLDAAYSGDFFFYRGADLSVQTHTHVAEQGVQLSAQSGIMEENFSDIFALGIRYLGSSGAAPPSLNVSLQDPAGVTVLSQDFTTNTQIDLLRDFPGVVGNWTADLRILGNVEADVRLVALQSFAEGTL